MVPICQGCKWRFRIQRLIRKAMWWVAALGAVFLIGPYFTGWNRRLQHMTILLLAVIVISPFVLVEVFWPRIFDTTAREGSVDYEFASKEYAIEFLLLNKQHVLKTNLFLDGKPLEIESDES